MCTPESAGLSSAQTFALLPSSPAIGTGGAITTVAASASGSTTTIYVHDTAAIASTPGQYLILIDGEEWEVTNVNLATNALTVVPEVNGVASAISANDNVYLYTDQRGVVRTTPDIGAFEFAPTDVYVLLDVSTTPGTLSYAIAAAITESAGNTPVSVDFLGGPGTIDLTGDVLDLNKGPGTGLITINATNQNITINANATSGVFAVASGSQVAMDSLTIEGGNCSSVNASSGGGILNHGTLTLSNSTLSGNTAFEGGAIRNFGTLTISSSTLSGNSAYCLPSKGSGGGISNLGLATVNNCEFSGNISFSDVSGGNGDGGGGIDNLGTLTVSSSTFTGNSATNAGNGGGIFSLGSLTVTNSTFSSNTADFSGGTGGSAAASTLLVNLRW